MPHELTLPDPGEGIHEAEIVELFVSAGDEVEESDVLLNVETDKAVVEIPSPFTGTVDDVLVEVGDRIEVGDPVLTYEVEGEAEAGGEEASSESEADEEAEATEAAEATGEAEVTEAAEEAEATEAAEATGEAEVTEEIGEADENGKAARSDQEREAPSSDRPVPAAPATRRLARELGVDLRRIEVTGPEGRVTADDVRAAAEGAGEEAASVDTEKPKEAETVGTPEPEASAEPEESGEEPAPEAPGAEDVPARTGGEERIPLRSVRRTTARRMSEAWTRIPHVTHIDHADITELEAFRSEHVDAIREEGGALTLTVFLLKALAATLKEFPRFNARLDDEAEEVVLFRHHHFGVAVDTDRGLLVPVVRDVDEKSLAELSATLTRITEKARSQGLDRSEMKGGTFTVTNPGPIGGDAFTPIINPPQVAILGAGRASWEPTVRTDDREEREVVPRLRLPLCLAFDHRVNDGADAARFVRHLVGVLEDPDAFVLHL